ncbi:hypothetical protein Scep_000258 [Stephania cephalantha]|uniref:Uncharacterized protein n=1 Tax=Stephania cephalantha TaxID=152367 RepID=A0AAP0Q296_9MAGN
MLMGFPEDMHQPKSFSLMAVCFYFLTYEAAVALLLIPLSSNSYEDKLLLIIVFLLPHILFSIFICVRSLRLKVLEAFSTNNDSVLGDGRFSQAGCQDKMVEESLAATKRKEESELKNVALEALEALKKERAKYKEDRVAWENEIAKYEEDRVAWENERASYEEECQRWQEERLAWEDERANLEEELREWEYERQGWEHEREDLETRREICEKESERRRKDLEAELDTVRKCAQLYRSVLHDYDSFNLPKN